MLNELVGKVKRLRRIKVHEVSVVPRGAVALSSIARVLKSAAVEMPICKTDPERRMVFGIVSVATVKGREYEDLQGDVMDSETMADMAWNYALHSGIAGENHQRIGVGKLVESVALTTETQRSIVDALKAKGIDAQMNLGAECWWLGVQLSPDVFAKVANGTYKAFSIGGRAERVDKLGDDEMELTKEVQDFIDKRLGQRFDALSDDLKTTLAKFAEAVVRREPAPVEKSADPHEPTPGTALAELTKLSREVQKGYREGAGRFLSEAQCMARVIQKHPELYARHRQESATRRGLPHD